MAGTMSETKVVPIDKSSVHKICSGQVILDLATSVKEVVENALDAQATSIEIRLKEYGSELIEVADNGTGIRPGDYHAVAAKYHTSKISSFKDLQSVESFGFRGEALSSLCAVAQVSITTRTQLQDVGTRLTFDHNGNLTGQQPAARSIGTTVTIKELFKTLPVRFKAFQRNVKKEYVKLVQQLQAYAIVATSVKLLATNQVGKAARSTVISTHGKPTLRDNLLAVFGTKVVSTLEPVQVEAEGFNFSGFVSSAVKSGSKTNADKQFFFLNGRPVELPKALRVVNDVYRSLSSPATAGCKALFALNIEVSRIEVDVNVTPDKRTVMLIHENQLLALLRKALEAVWDPSKWQFSQSLGASGNARNSEKPSGSGARQSLLASAMRGPHSSDNKSSAQTRSHADADHCHAASDPGTQGASECARPQPALNEGCSSGQLLPDAIVLAVDEAVADAAPAPAPALAELQGKQEGLITKAPLCHTLHVTSGDAGRKPAVVINDDDPTGPDAHPALAVAEERGRLGTSAKQGSCTPARGALAKALAVKAGPGSLGSASKAGTRQCLSAASRPGGATASVLSVGDSPLRFDAAVDSTVTTTSGPSKSGGLRFRSPGKPDRMLWQDGCRSGVIGMGSERMPGSDQGDVAVAVPSRHGAKRSNGEDADELKRLGSHLPGDCQDVAEFVEKAGGVASAETLPVPRADVPITGLAAGRDGREATASGTENSAACDTLPGADGAEGQHVEDDGGACETVATQPSSSAPPTGAGENDVGKGGDQVGIPKGHTDVDTDSVVEACAAGIIADIDDEGGEGAAVNPRAAHGSNDDHAAMQAALHCHPASSSHASAEQAAERAASQTIAISDSMGGSRAHRRRTVPLEGQSHLGHEHSGSCSHSEGGLKCAPHHGQGGACHGTAREVSSLDAGAAVSRKAGRCPRYAGGLGAGQIRADEEGGEHAVPARVEVSSEKRRRSIVSCGTLASSSMQARVVEVSGGAAEEQGGEGCLHRAMAAERSASEEAGEKGGQGSGEGSCAPGNSDRSKADTASPTFNSIRPFGTAAGRDCSAVVTNKEVQKGGTATHGVDGTALPPQDASVLPTLQAGWCMSEDGGVMVRVDVAGMRPRRAAARVVAVTRASATSGAAAFKASSLQPLAADAGPLEEEAAAATTELERVFKKSDFLVMQVHGQFNLGFIIASIGRDVFIIDQHAADEKFNFERLRDSTVLNKQPLIAPLDLSLSAIDDLTLREHLPLFEQNGFGFVEDGASCHMRLTAVPFSKATTFGAADVHELVCFHFCTL